MGSGYFVYAIKLIFVFGFVVTIWNYIVQKKIKVHFLVHVAFRIAYSGLLLAIILGAFFVEGW